MKKLRLIYEPTGAAKEYADLALNVYNGCTHGCTYCYNNGRYSKPGAFFKSSKPRALNMSDLVKDCEDLKSQYGEAVPEVLISFIGDAYQPAERALGKTRLVIRMLIDQGIPFTILTKSDLIQRDFDILADYRDKFRLGMTILSPFEIDLQAWEPGAPGIGDRVETLWKAKDLGISTWVSLEPVMNIQSAIQLIRRYGKYVDIWHIGKLNHMQPPEPIDWLQARERIKAALDSVGAAYKFKTSMEDL